MNVMRKKEAARYLGIGMQDLALAIRTGALKAAIAVDSDGKPFEGIAEDSAEALADDISLISSTGDTTRYFRQLDGDIPIRLRYDGGSMVINPYEFFTGSGAATRVRGLSRIIPKLTGDCWHAPSAIRQYLLISAGWCGSDLLNIETAQKSLVNDWIAYYGIKSFYGVYAKRRFDALEREKKDRQKWKVNFTKWADEFARGGI